MFVEVSWGILPAMGILRRQVSINCLATHVVSNMKLFVQSAPLCTKYPFTMVPITKFPLWEARELCFMSNNLCCSLLGSGLRLVCCDWLPNTSSKRVGEGWQFSVIFLFPIFLIGSYLQNWHRIFLASRAWLLSEEGFIYGVWQYPMSCHAPICALFWSLHWWSCTGTQVMSKLLWCSVFLMWCWWCIRWQAVFSTVQLLLY